LNQVSRILTGYLVPKLISKYLTEPRRKQTLQSFVMCQKPFLSLYKRIDYCI